MRVIAPAPIDLRPGACASVCAVEEVGDAGRAAALGVEIGTFVYLVEFGDGVAIEVPESLLEADDEVG